MERLCLKVEDNFEKVLLDIFTHFAKFGLEMHIGRGPKIFQNWIHIISSILILQTLKSLLSHIQHQLLPGYHTCKKIEW